MSEEKIPPSLLDGLLVGQTMFEHHGVRCCPAIKEDTEERYIVKIVSIPANEKQLDALLLTGAFADKEQAQIYFREMAENVQKEIDILETLSKLEGFLPHSGSEILELPVGFRVLMLNPYQPSLAKLITSEPMTHLAAINLGLDMCAALTAARRAGYLYIDLKPENIFYSETKGYCISDLGFLPLSSVKYASLPEKYRSIYTAPEVSDEYATLNDTIDIYALGLVLYQIYNNGELPALDIAADEQLPPPMYADYELANIILRACSPDPARRWSDPAQMGQELVNYMQRNAVNDVPIVPAPAKIPPLAQEESEEFLSESENEAELAQLLSMIPDEDVPIDDPQDNILDNDSVESSPDQPTTDDINDVEKMLAQADELLALELPEPVVAPDPIDVPIPPPILPEREPEEVPENTSPAANDLEEEPLPEETHEEEPMHEEIPEEESQDEEPTEEDEPYTAPSKKRRFAAVFALCIIFSLIVAAVWGGIHYYQTEYIQKIDALHVSGVRDQITVQIVSEIDESLLTVVCTDAYGNALRSPVKEHYATFTGLNSGTLYKIQLEISGSHKLTGHTTGSYTTATQTIIHNFTAITGGADGSAKLSFSVTGPDSDLWMLEYISRSEKKLVEFRGHNLTLQNLNVGEEYTFHLLSKEELYLTGELGITHTASKVILAQNLALHAYQDGVMDVRWETPEDIQNILWTVVCRNDDGFEKTVTVTEPQVVFTELDTTHPYTITVTAEGMSQSQTLGVAANPISLTELVITPLSPWMVNIGWEYAGPAPHNGWQVVYTIAEQAPVTVQCSENNLQIPLAGKDLLTVEVSPLHDGPVFGISGEYIHTFTEPFPGFSENVSVELYAVPELENWSIPDLLQPQNSFPQRAPICLLLSPIGTYTEEMVSVSVVITDTSNNMVSEKTKDYLWSSICAENQGLFILQEPPTDIGRFTLSLYMNDVFICSANYEIQPATEAG